MNGKQIVYERKIEYTKTNIGNAVRWERKSEWPTEGETKQNDCKWQTLLFDGERCIAVGDSSDKTRFQENFWLKHSTVWRETECEREEEEETKSLNSTKVATNKILEDKKTSQTQFVPRKYFTTLSRFPFSER